jgi:hypothetical protein
MKYTHQMNNYQQQNERAVPLCNYYFINNSISNSIISNGYRVDRKFLNTSLKMLK